MPTLLRTEGYSIVSAESDCSGIGGPTFVISHESAGVWSLSLAGVYDSGALRKPSVCHVTATLDNGTQIPMVLSAMTGVKGACCGPGILIYTGGFNTIVIRAPAGYVPDSGVEAGRDASDASDAG